MERTIRYEEQGGGAYLDVRVALGVFQEIKDKLATLHRPPALGRNLVLLALSGPANISLVASKRNALLFGDDILKECDRAAEVKPLHSLDGLPGVLEVNSQV